MSNKEPDQVRQFNRLPDILLFIKGLNYRCFQRLRVLLKARLVEIQKLGHGQSMVYFSLTNSKELTNPSEVLLLKQVSTEQKMYLHLFTLQDGLVTPVIKGTYLVDIRKGTVTDETPSGTIH